jgi:hypothetical protein
MNSIPISPTDVTRIKVIISAMRKGKWELEGDEILAFAQGFAWASEMHERISLGLQQKPEEKQAPSIHVKSEPIKKGKR